MEPFWIAFAALIVVAGPWKAAIVFAEKTTTMSRGNRRRTAILTVLMAAIAGVVVMLIGQSLVNLFHIEPAGFLIGAGLIVVVFAVQMVIAPAEHESHAEPAALRPMAVAVYPLAIPMLITPPAVAALTAIGIEAAATEVALASAVAALAAVMAVNLVVFLILARYEDKLPGAAWDVGGRLLGVFLAGFGVSIIIEGFKHIS